MKKTIVRLLVAALLGTLAVSTSACGEEELMERPVDPRLAARKGKAAKKKGLPPDALVIIKLNNPKWDLVQPHYKKFLAQKHATPKDAFRPWATKFIPRPQIADDEDGSADISTVEEEEEPRGPLQQYPLKEYNLMVIMSGTAVPKAVVVDPKAQAYVVQRDTRIGNKGGIVESITQYMVVVKEPNTEQAVKLTIKPPYIDLVSQVGFNIDPTDIDEEFAVPSAIDSGVTPFPMNP